MVIVLVCMAALIVARIVVSHRIRYPAAPKPKTGKKYIACVGDSITHGYGVIGHRKTRTYPVYLAGMLPDGWQTLNYGLGARTLQREGDTPYTKENFYPLSLEANADIYLLMLGTNDSKPGNWNKERFATQLREFVESYLNLSSHPRVVLLQPPRCFPSKGKTEVAFEISNEFIRGDIHEMIAMLGAEKELPVIDLYALTQDHPEWFVDGVHPNAAGNYAIAACIAWRLMEMF